MPFYETRNSCIHYKELGEGIPVLIIPGGGLNSSIAWLAKSAPFNAVDEFSGEYRCIVADLRSSYEGQSTGLLDLERPWDAYTDDHLGLMDNLGIKRFMVLGYCIGGPAIWNLLKRAPDRVVAAVIAQPSGNRAEQPDQFYEANMAGWGPELVRRRPDITMEVVERFVSKLYRANPDFVFSVSRDFVRSCQTPVLVLPDDSRWHPLETAMESVMLAPRSEVSIFPWIEPKERIPLVVRQIRTFLRAHRPE